MAHALWHAVQAVALVATGALVLGLFWRPDETLGVLWDVVVPLLPASFLVSPGLWRNVCPLASLNMLSNGLAGRGAPARWLASTSLAMGIVLLAVLVPARHFLFNNHGAALASTIIAIGAGAVVLGAVFDAKAGFCNAMCPVLPVERLYGQRPLVTIGNQRCASCTLCAKACLDIAPEKSVRRTLGRAWHGPTWLATPFGAFAAAFPGFVLGYFTTDDAPLASAGSIYVHVAALAAASYLITAAAVRAFRIPAARAFPALAAAAVSLYYWFAAPTLAAGVGVAETGAIILQLAALGLVAVWWWRAARSPKVLAS